MVAMDRNSLRKLVEGQLLRLEGNAFQDCMGVVLPSCGRLRRADWGSDSGGRADRIRGCQSRIEAAI